MGFKQKLAARYEILAESEDQKWVMEMLADDPCADIEDQEDKDNCLDDEGDAAHYFKDPKALPPGTWLIHFTNHPTEIVHQGFKGSDWDVLGLSVHNRRKEGPFGCAYQLKDVTEHSLGRELGKHAIMFQTDDAILTYHNGDDENQVIFLNTSMKNLHALKNKDKRMVVLDPKTDKPLFDISNDAKGFQAASKKLKA